MNGKQGTPTPERGNTRPREKGNAIPPIAHTGSRERKRRHKQRTKALEAVTYWALIGLGCSVQRAEELSRALVVEQLARLQKVIAALAGWDYMSMTLRTS